MRLVLAALTLLGYFVCAIFAAPAQQAQHGFVARATVKECASTFRTVITDFVNSQTAQTVRDGSCSSSGWDATAKLIRQDMTTMITGMQGVFKSCPEFAALYRSTPPREIMGQTLYEECFGVMHNTQTMTRDCSSHPPLSGELFSMFGTP